MKAFLKSDLFFKLVSVVAAAILWLYVINYENPEFQVAISNIPVKYENSEVLENNNLVITSQSQDVVTIKINGRRKTVSKLDKNDVTAVIDLKSVTAPGEYVIPVKASFSVSNVSVADGSVPKIRIIAEREIVSEKSVSVIPKGAVKEGFFAVAEQPADKISLIAPESMANLAASVRAEIDVSGLDKTTEKSVPLKLFDANGAPVNSRFLKLQPSEMAVKCFVYPIKEVPVTWTAVGYMPTGAVSVFPSVSTVKVAGPEEVLAELTSVNIGTVNLSSFSSYNSSRTFELKDSPDLEGLYIADGTETIVMSMRFAVLEEPDEDENPEEEPDEKTITSNVTISSVSLVGLPAGFTAELITPSVTVSISGKESDVSSVTEADFSAVADLSGISPDTVSGTELELPVSVSTGKNVTLGNTPSVRVRITAPAPTVTEPEGEPSEEVSEPAPIAEVPLEV